jgi:hypothetical protein
MTDILDAMLATAQEERATLHISGFPEDSWVWRTDAAPCDPHLFFGSEAECRAWIDRRAMLAALRVLAASDLAYRTMLTALIEESERD